MDRDRRLIQVFAAPTGKEPRNELEHLAFSPDGKYFAFSVTEAAGQSEGITVRYCWIRGENPRSRPHFPLAQTHGGAGRESLLVLVAIPRGSAVR
jgi:hypothetical protein